MQTLTVANLICLALLTGNEFCVAAFVEPILRTQPDAQQLASLPLFARRLGKAMPGWYSIALLSTAAVAFVLNQRQGTLLSGAAVSLVVQLVVLAVTLTLLVPRNNRLARMTGPYPGWQTDARQWDRLHQLRVFLLLAATVALIF